MRYGFILLGFCILTGGADGQPALVKQDVAMANTCLGPAEAHSVVMEPGRNVVVAVLANSLTDDDLVKFRKEITSLYQATRNASSLVRLATISGSTVQISGPFGTRAQLQAALRDLALRDFNNVEAHPNVETYSQVADAVQQFGPDWAALILVGRFPGVDPELAPFTSAWLGARFRAAKVRVNYSTPSGESSEILDAAIAATAGSHVTDLSQYDLNPGEQFHEVSWRDPAPAAGIHICPVTLLDPEGRAVLKTASITAFPATAVPDLEHYALLRQKIDSLRAVLQRDLLSSNQMNQAEEDLNAALAISPLEEETLRLGEMLYTRPIQDAKLVKILDALTVAAPMDAALFAELGHARFRLQDWDAAEQALLRTRELKPGDPSVAEELARIRLTHKDDQTALAFLEERLALAAGTQELWMLRADISQRLGDWQRLADSVEHAIPLGGVTLERRTSLIRLYLQHDNPDRALVHIRAVTENLPSDAAVRAEYAGFLDQLKQPAEALAAWKRTLEADPGQELAHYRVTRLLIEQNALDAALAAAEAGIRSAPKSARLLLAKAEVLEKQDRFYDARRTLREAAPNLPERALLERLAEMEDAGGEHAARVYRSVAEAEQQEGAAQERITATLQSGLQTSLREADPENILWFQSRLGIQPDSSAGSGDDTVVIPGGLAALSLIAGSRPSSPEQFLVEFARTVSDHLYGQYKEVSAAYTQTIREHFRRVSALAAFGTPQGDHVTVTIAFGDKKAQKNTEKVLDLLGWQMRTSREGVKIQPAESGESAKHQETATALAIDEIGMQQSLEAGQPFSFNIPMEKARVVLGEASWKKQFYQNEHYPGGLAEAMASDLALAQTYAALGQIDSGTARALESAIGLRKLADNYGAELHKYASALAIENGRVEVPGGDAAAPVWSKVVGANPAQPDAFLRALLDKDDGKLLAYYAALSALDLRHQRLFTRTLARTARFYELFKDAPETRSNLSKLFTSGPFVEFLSEVPLDDDGNVDFPGSPEVWMVAKGQSHSESSTTRMLRKMKRKATPDQEDEILLRLARMRYKESTERSELDNFIAVVRIDQHRDEPLDEGSALLLAQHYADDGAAYPFFSVLTGLQQKQFEQFFALSAALRSLSSDDRGPQLAPVYALIEIVCLAQESGALHEAQAADLFGRIVDRFAKVDSRAARTTAAVDLMREILAVAAPGRQADPGKFDPDKGIREALLRASGAGENREKRFQQVLELQKVPTLAAVFALSDAARNLATGKGSAEEEIKTLETRATELISEEIPREWQLSGKERDYIEGFRPRRLQEMVKDLKEKTARKKGDPQGAPKQDAAKVAQNYLEDLDAPVRWALEGIVYAYFLDPEDVLVSEDPLLLRKHRFFTTAPAQRSALVFEPSELAQSSEKAGSYFSGGMADFGSAAGRAATANQKFGGKNGDFIAAKQIAALRSTNWGMLRDEDLRLLGLKITVAREWIVHAASQPEMEAALADDTLGLLSLARRTGLRSALARKDWPLVWNAVTLSDLYYLGDRYRKRYPMSDPWASAATRALRELAARNGGERLQLLGAEFDKTFGSSRPELIVAPPYEQFENDVSPERLAERSAEFKLYLARYADSAGLPASEIGRLAEPVARVILGNMQLSDMHDWRSALAAYASLDQKLISQAEAK